MCGKKSVLIVNRDQFGYHIDTYYYAKYGQEKYEITYVCIDSNFPRIGLPGVTIVYIPRKGNIFIRFMMFLLTSIKYSYLSKVQVIFVKQFSGAFLFRLANPFKKMILDIRTGSVQQNRWKQRIENILIFIDTLFYSYITVISKSLAKRLKVMKGHIILPLGAEVTELKVQPLTNKIHLLYVGILIGRRIEDTIIGFAKFYREYSDKFHLSYSIVGQGSGKEEKNLSHIIDKHGLENVVRLHGYIQNSDLINYFEKADLGVCYVPINNIYNFQPATKIFEYALAGIPTIATNTFENKLVINDSNGILINDTPDDFYLGLVKYSLMREQFRNRMKIQDSLRSFTWKLIVENIWIPLIES
jgi:glycosyltransferase involved in cell wall biosynthesis